ncbi:MAG: pyrroline-5-carboxylate reductase [Bacteroidaceae bacterium]|nr:pyrroline-5-carboxylate reductase [Bacteroidaceae bacterium]
MKVAIIGSGNMGGAIARGLFRSGRIAASDLTCTARSQKTLDTISRDIPGSSVTTDNSKAVEEADIVILAVKPWLVEQVINGLKESLKNSQIVISVAAGIGTAQLATMLTDKDGKVPAIFYLIPNIAVEACQGVSLYCTANAGQEQINIVEDLFSGIGFVKRVEEKQMSAGTAIASCGIAYVFRYIRAIMEGGVEMGFYPKDAQEIAIATLKGAASILELHGTHPEQEVDKVTTPGGLTIRGLNAMEEAGFTHAVIAGLKAGK